MTRLSHTTPASDLTAVAPRRSPAVSDFVQLTKPRISVMVAITAWVGYELGRAGAKSVDGPALIAAVIGTALACAASAVFNQVFERDTDALMIRTRRRPLPAGRVSVEHASLYGLALAAGALALLAVFSNFLATLLAAGTIAGYLFVYTPLKRRAAISTFVGAIPGAMPPVIGYAVATGRVDAAAWIAFGIMFLWQIPHFLAIAWLYREDYARAGIQMLPVVDPSGRSTFQQMLLGALLLVPVAVLPSFIGLAGWVYLITAGVLSLAFLGVSVVLMVKRTTSWARGLFFASLGYLPIVLTVWLMDRVG